MNTSTCYFCGLDFADCYVIDADYLTGDGGSVCDKCAADVESVK